MFEPLEAVPIQTLSKLHYLIHELYLTNHLSFPEHLNCGTRCHPLLSLNPTICHLLNLTLTNLILSLFLFKFPLISSVLPLSGRCYRFYGLSPALLTKKRKKNEVYYCISGSDFVLVYALIHFHPFMHFSKQIRSECSFKKT